MKRAQFTLSWNHIRNAWNIYDSVSRQNVGTYDDHKKAVERANEYNRRARCSTI